MRALVRCAGMHTICRPPPTTPALQKYILTAMERFPDAPELHGLFHISHFHQWRLDSWVKALLLNGNAPWWTIVSSENAEDLIRCGGPEDVKIQPVVSWRTRKSAAGGAEEPVVSRTGDGRFSSVTFMMELQQILRILNNRCKVHQPIIVQTRATSVASSFVVDHDTSGNHQQKSPIRTITAPESSNFLFFIIYAKFYLVEIKTGTCCNKHRIFSEKLQQ